LSSRVRRFSLHAYPITTPHSQLSTFHCPLSNSLQPSFHLSDFKSARIGATSMIGYQRWWGHVVPTGSQTASNYGLFYFDHIVCPLHFLHFPLFTLHTPLPTPTFHSPFCTTITYLVFFQGLYCTEVANLGCDVMSYYGACTYPLLILELALYPICKIWFPDCTSKKILHIPKSQRGSLLRI
jgi:hypothetical protein